MSGALVKGRPTRSASLAATASVLLSFHFVISFPVRLGDPRRRRIVLGGLYGLGLLIAANGFLPFSGSGSILQEFAGNGLLAVASVTAPGLVVIGTPNLTIGSPGLGEVLRRRAAAAGPLPDLQLGQGLDMAFSGHGTPVWCCYASAALTLDLTAFIG